MKHSFVKMLMLAIVPMLAVSCFDNVPKVEDLPTDAVSFEYRIDGDYALDYYVGSTITFVNTSPTAGEARWEFGDGTETTGDQVQHFYEVAGTYYVTLHIGELQRKQVIMISDIKPLLSINPIEGGICEVLSTVVNFSLEVPNPQNLPLTYRWIMPAGTKDANGELLAESTDRLPGDVTFSNVGSQTVRLVVTMGGRELEEGSINVQVGYNQPVPTLYYAEQGGHIMAYKLIPSIPSGMQVSPFDLGLSSGQHPFSLCFKDSLLYVLDCGKQFYYIDDSDGVMGDGKISVIAKDGSKVETMISNAGQAAFDDPFYGTIEGDKLYYANRNTGIIALPLNTRNAMYNKTDYPYWVQHTTLGYYNNGWSYGSIGGMFGKANGTWFWCKHFNGTGIFRWTESDILDAPIAAGSADNVPQAGIAIAGMCPKSFAYDKTRQKFYFTTWDVGYGGFYACTLAELDAIGSSKGNLKPYKKLTASKLGFEPNVSGSPASVEGTGSEPVAICQLTLDEATGCVYFAFRNYGDATSAPTGIYRYNPATDVIEPVIEGVSAYGLVVNNEPTKLF